MTGAFDPATKKSEAYKAARDWGHAFRSKYRDRELTCETLEDIKDDLIKLAQHTELFSIDTFPVDCEGNSATLELLYEDPNNEAALYIVAKPPGAETIPHNHTIWAIMVGISGEEISRQYERKDDVITFARNGFRESGEVRIAPNYGVTLLQDGIHSMHVDLATPSLAFHLYGKNLNQLENRIGFDFQAGISFPIKGDSLDPEKFFKIPYPSGQMILGLAGTALTALGLVLLAFSANIIFCSFALLGSLMLMRGLILGRRTLRMASVVLLQ